MEEVRRAGLGFTPAVLPGQRIRLKVAPSVSELDYTTAVQFVGFAVPGLTERSSETTIEVGNGQTFVIGGLLSDTSRALNRRIPGLGDLPVLGSLFRSVEYRKNQTELMILVTAELVAPLDPQQVPSVPGEKMVDPNDFDCMAWGCWRASRTRPAAQPPLSRLARQRPPRASTAWGVAEYDESK